MTLPEIAAHLSAAACPRALALIVTSRPPASRNRGGSLPPREGERSAPV
jgi:hypothetical protein